MTRHLLVDGGQSACRLSVIEGEETAYVVGLPGLSYQMDADGPQTILSFLHHAERHLSEVGLQGFASVWLGLTGMPRSASLRRVICRAAMEVLSAEAAAACSDLVPAYVGAIGLGPGAVLSAGSGTVALAVSACGRSAMTGGHGALFGDQGSAFWIGREALRAVVRAQDEWGPATALSQAAQAHYGDVDEVPKRVRASSNAVNDVAQFAGPACEVAEQGDAVAARIVQRAAALLAEMLCAAANNAHGEGARNVTASWNGRLLSSRGLLWRVFSQEVAARAGDRLKLAPPRGGPLEGLKTMAMAPSIGTLGAHVYLERSEQ